MAKRFYIVPKIGSGSGPADPIRPKYFDNISQLEAIDYGLEDVFMVGAETTEAEHSAIYAEFDAVSIPGDIDSLLSITVLETLQARLHGLKIPSEWITIANTYRDVLGVTGRLFFYMQRYHERENRVFFQGDIMLEDGINRLTQAERDAMDAAAVSLGLDVSSITNQQTISEALKGLADQMPSFTLFGESF